MRSDVPKVLHRALGLPLVGWVVEAARAAGVERLVVVAAPDQREAVRAALAEQLASRGPAGVDAAGAARAPLALEVVVQAEPRGTADAVLAARPALEGFAGPLLVLLGDAPCVRPDALRRLLAEHAAAGAAMSVLTGTAREPRGYGRLVRGQDGEPAAIVEERDADPGTLAIREINSGVMALEVPALWDVLARIGPSPRTGELYLTDALELVRAAGRRVVAVAAAAEEDVLGVNDRAQLAQVTATLRRRVNARHLEAGCTIVDPETAFIDARAELEPDCRVEPFVVIDGPARIGRGARVGPFAHVRGGSVVGPGALVGNFVEVARSDLAAGARALHLAYLGDATVGEGANVGAGTVFANWDGERHHASAVGAGAAVGAGTVLVGPARVGAGARTGAGAVLVRADVPAGETWVGVPARPLRRAGPGEGGAA